LQYREIFTLHAELILFVMKSLLIVEARRLILACDPGQPQIRHVISTDEQRFAFPAAPRLIDPNLNSHAGRQGHVETTEPRNDPATVNNLLLPYLKV
jgi:hypothetical protein